MEYGLPQSLEINGTEYSIRSDFRDILEIMSVLNDAELQDQERGFLALLIFYPDFKEDGSGIPFENTQEAMDKLCWFINGGKENEEIDIGPRLFDWEQDFPLIIAPVNRVLGHESRSDAYMHWWTFLGAFMEIGECSFAQVVHIRSQLKEGKTLDKADREWYAKNKNLVNMKTRFSANELAELKKWGGG